ncbi:hypothetical protein HYPSUDRAFT_1002031 [Hypholoma sublateritium FD-334 SS-4]|uniref:Uncharacterized protein n=1 Tax=Hypholoma sublateritium (strain FD-334 SS-4) TaxID=945553 RepID=A0A0D2NFN1_HYPSF|nr:hypothetical protein HYPSUDRAFT_1002031 [Hypholoma sublateritium FD-334 SS-4]
MRTIPGNRTCPSTFGCALKLTAHVNLCHKKRAEMSRATCYRWENSLFPPFFEVIAIQEVVKALQLDGPYGMLNIYPVWFRVRNPDETQSIPNARPTFIARHRPCAARVCLDTKQTRMTAHTGAYIDLEPKACRLPSCQSNVRKKIRKCTIFTHSC